MVLTKAEQRFGVKHSEITVSYRVKDRSIGDGDVWFRSDLSTSISVTKHQASWQCGIVFPENERCDRVRNGDFLWLDTYTIKFTG